MRKILIADIHGCYDEFLHLLKAINFSHDKDKLIILGDMIDRGKDPSLVVEHMMRLKESMQDRLVVIRGNHEQLMIDADLGSAEFALWMYNGGGKTISSFKRKNIDLTKAKEWFETLPLFYEDDDVICVHAGAVCGIPLDKNDPQTLLWDRDFDELSRWDYKNLVCGHTPVKDVQMANGSGTGFKTLRPGGKYEFGKSGCFLIDTGCVFGYKLTALIVEGKSFEIKNVHLSV